MKKEYQVIIDWINENLKIGIKENITAEKLINVLKNIINSSDYLTDNYIQLFSSDEEFQQMHDNGLDNKLYFNSSTNVLRIGLLDADGFIQFDMDNISKIPDLKTALDNETVERARVDALKLNKPTTNATSDYVLLADGSTLPKSDFGKVDKVMGVAPDANKNVDFSGVALNWTHANQRFSGLADRSSDATFNGIMGLDNSGNAAKITQSARLLEATLQGTTSEQALRIGNLLNGGNGSSGAISVNLISPPLLQNTRNDIEYVLLRGANLLLNNTDMSISICDEGKSVIQRIPNEQIINNSTTELLFYYNFYQFTTGTYYLKITSGVKTYFTTLDLQIVDEIENIDINAITWDIGYPPEFSSIS